MHCIKDNFVPSKELFIVIINAPIQTTIKMLLKISLELPLEVKYRITLKIKVISKGPHKSQCFNALIFSGLLTGIITILNLLYILIMSRIMLSCIDSLRENEVTEINFDLLVLLFEVLGLTLL